MAEEAVISSAECVYADASLNGENTFLTRMAGTAEQTDRQSDYYTLARIQ